MPDVLTTTLAQAIQWVIVFGVPAGVAYFLGWIGLPEGVKNFVKVVAVAAIAAGTVAGVTFVPQAYLDMTLVNLAFAAISALLASAGIKFGVFKFTQHYAAYLGAQQTLAYYKAGEDLKD